MPSVCETLGSVPSTTYTDSNCRPVNKCIREDHGFGYLPPPPTSGVGLSLKINLIVSAKGTKVELARLKSLSGHGQNQ